MKNMTHLGLCLLSLTLGWANQSTGQQAGSGPSTGSTGNANAAPAGQPAGLNSTTGARTGIEANSGTTGLNDAATRNSSPGPDIGPPERNNGAVQPLYQNSAAVPGGTDPSNMAGAQHDHGDSSMNSNGQTISDNGQARGRLGVFLVDSDGAGVRVSRVTSGSAADKAGLRSGDIILQVNGRGTKAAGSAAQMIRVIPAGQTATLTIWRDGDQHQLQVVMDAAREPRRVGYRGDMNSMTGMSDDSAESSRSGSDDRVTRLEQQLQFVTEDLQQLRQEVSAMRSASGSGIGAGSQGLGRPMPTNGTAPSPPQGTNDAAGTTGAAGAAAGSGAAGATNNSGPATSGTGGAAATSGAAGTPASSSGTSTKPSGKSSTDSLFQ